MAQGLLRYMRRSLLTASAALVLACTFLAFQVELFDTEYEANHPAPSSSTSSLTAPSVTWESFDKDNALKAFVFDAGVRSECSFIIPSPPIIRRLTEPLLQRIRDKSPPGR